MTLHFSKRSSTFAREISMLRLHAQPLETQGDLLLPDDARRLQQGLDPMSPHCANSLADSGLSWSTS
ncbi:MAG TPA: hypothetical protein VKK19_04635 [Candidatus Dormibacteraeota bacterium]|nr:hypothetical protein [Candidatus Dormibacteraeota bacterium]